MNLPIFIRYWYIWHMENGIKICFVFCFLLKSYSETLFLVWAKLPHYIWIILVPWVLKEICETVHFLKNYILSYIFWFFSLSFFFLFFSFPFFYFFSVDAQNYSEDIHDPAIDFMKIGTVLVDPGGLFLALLGWIQDRCVQTDGKKEYRNSLEVSPGRIR